MYLMLSIFTRVIVGRYSLDCTVTAYGLDGPWIESQTGSNFPHPYRQELGPTRSPINLVPYLFPWGKATKVWRWPRIPIYHRG